MSNYKFNVGDKVKILKMDEWSAESMKENIGKVGIITRLDDDEEVNGYDVLLEGKSFGYGCWYMEDSLELVKELISKDDVLAILYEVKENGVANIGTILDLIRRVRNLPCK